MPFARRINKLTGRDSDALLSHEVSEAVSTVHLLPTSRDELVALACDVVTIPYICSQHFWGIGPEGRQVRKRRFLRHACG
jgi:hypothetical protein